MPKPDVTAAVRRFHPLHSLWAVAKFLLHNIHRIYSAVLILLIGWLTFMALSYLVTSLAIEKGPPPQIIALPTRLSADILQTDWAAWQALAATENARSPLAHYHRLDSWIAPDKFNDCTRSGCHAALPHARRKEVRAFLNMHATSIHCGVCHMTSPDRPLPLAWYSLSSGDVSDPPAVLRLYDILTSEAGRTKLTHADPAQQEEFVELIRQAAGDVQDPSGLERLADHFEALRPGSESFERLISEAQLAVSKHFRGEYGSKIGLLAEGTKYKHQPKLLMGHPNTAQAVKAWFNRPRDLGEKETEALLAALHPMKREKALHCTDCHTTQTSLVDFAELGYPAIRRDALVGSIVFRLIEHISTGQPLHMPEIAPSESKAPPRGN